LKLGSPPPHKEARQRRKELRRKLLAEQEELERQMKELQAANENKQQELESVRKVRRRTEMARETAREAQATGAGKREEGWAQDRDGKGSAVPLGTQATHSLRSFAFCTKVRSCLVS
jgi:hypothetical protein